jgi:hypothetical protein
MMIHVFNRGPLYNEASEAAAGGGGGDAGSAGAGVNAGAPQAGADAEPPAWAKALIAKVDAFETKLAKPADPPKVDAPKADPSVPPWAQQIQADLASLKGAQAAEQLNARRGQVAQAVLGKMPEATRATGKAVLDGMLSSVALDANTDVAKLAEQLTTQMQSQHPVLFAVSGSSRNVIQTGPDGKIDWSGVKSFDDIPPELISSAPDEVVARIQAGGSSGASAGLPRNLFSKK